MHIGFTGTRHGMTPLQMRAFRQVLDGLLIDSLEHGDCVGADNEAASIAYSYRQDAVAAGKFYYLIIAHPPIEERFRAFNTWSDEVRTPLSYFSRNRMIVDDTELLIGCPFTSTWQNRGGTFYTMDYAIKRGKPLIIIWPDGTVEHRPCQTTEKPSGQVS